MKMADTDQGNSDFDELMSPWRQAIPQAVSQFKEAFDKGEKIVGAYCVYFPQEIAMALGAIPVALCNTKPVYMAAGERHLPRNLCPLIKSSYGFALEDQCPFFHFSNVVVGETTCDGKKKMFEYLGRLKPVHVMHLPHDPTLENATSLWRSELERVIAFLETELGREYSEGGLKEAIKLRNGQRRMMRRLYEASKLKPPKISGHDLMKLTEISLYTRNAASLRDTLEGLATALDRREDSPFEQGRPRILLTGVPIGTASDKMVEIIEELGSPVVAQEMCSGQKTFLDDVSEDGDPIDALVEWSLKLPCACQSPNPGRLERIGEMVRDYSADGIVDFTWTACHTYACESQAIREFSERLEIPYINIESDYGDADREQLTVRAQAFLDMCSG
jgi:benzoyl-CoA reductase/2-hydroxyglutaryl-CoA dehydratase subunit BcrC/BadD/HgdB